MNDPQEKTPKIPIIFITIIIWIPMPVLNARVLINHGIDSREQWDSFRQIFNFIPALKNHDLTDKQD